MATLLGRKAPAIAVGDRFMRTGDMFRKEWEVTRVWEPMALAGIPHARLVSIEKWPETRIVSVATLAEHDFFEPYHAPGGDEPPRLVPPIAAPPLTR